MPIAATRRLENTRDKSKIECMSARSKTAKKNEEESLTLTVLTMEGDCILDFCLEQDSYDSGYSKTNEVFSFAVLTVSEFDRDIPGI